MSPVGRMRALLVTLVSACALMLALAGCGGNSVGPESGTAAGSAVASSPSPAATTAATATERSSAESSPAPTPVSSAAVSVQPEPTPAASAAAQPSAAPSPSITPAASQGQSQAAVPPTPANSPDPAPAATPAVPPLPANTVLLSVAGHKDHGVIFTEAAIELKDGDTALEVLKRTMRAHKIQMEYRGRSATAYVEGVDNLYERDHGATSGWMYRVNGTFPTKSAGAYEVKEGDIIEWLYTLDLGKDLGAPSE